jgi:hypothetical protein
VPPVPEPHPQRSAVQPRIAAAAADEETVGEAQAHGRVVGPLPWTQLKAVQRPVHPPPRRPVERRILEEGTVGAGGVLHWKELEVVPDAVGDSHAHHAADGARERGVSCRNGFLGEADDIRFEVWGDVRRVKD